MMSLSSRKTPNPKNQKLIKKKMSYKLKEDPPRISTKVRKIKVDNVEQLVMNSSERNNKKEQILKNMEKLEMTFNSLNNNNTISKKKECLPDSKSKDSTIPKKPDLPIDAPKNQENQIISPKEEIQISTIRNEGSSLDNNRNDLKNEKLLDEYPVSHHEIISQPPIKYKEKDRINKIKSPLKKQKTIQEGNKLWKKLLLNKKKIEEETESEQEEEKIENEIGEEFQVALRKSLTVNMKDMDEIKLVILQIYFTKT